MAEEFKSESEISISSLLDGFEKWKKENGRSSENPEFDVSASDLTGENSEFGPTIIIKSDKNLSENPEFDVSSAGTAIGTAGAQTTIVANAKANNLWADTGKFLNDPTRVQGSPKTKHGVAAEHLEVTKRNAADIKRGDAGDIARLSESQTDPVTDMTINGKAYQSKFYKTPQDTFDAFYKNERYDGVGKLVPKDQYNDVVKAAEKKAQYHRDQAKLCKASGDTEGYESNMKQAKRCDNIANTTESSELTSEQSHNAKSVVVKESLKNIGEAGLKAGGMAAATTAVISGASNFYAVVKGEKEAADAIRDTAKASAMAGVGAFGIGAGGAAFSTGLMQLSEKIGNEALSKALESFAGGAGPTYVIVGTVEVTKSLVKYSKGELDGKGLAIELGEKALCTTVSAVVGALTAELGPVSIAFSTAAYMATSSLYRGCIEAIRLAKTAAEARKLLPLLQSAYEDYREQTIQLKTFLKEQHQLRLDIIESSFSNMEKALLNDDLGNFNNQLSNLFDVYGKGLKFKSFDEFDCVMSDDSIPLTI